MTLNDLLLVIIGAAAGGGIIWWMLGRKRKSSGESDDNNQQQLQLFSKQITDQLHRVTEQIDKRLADSSRSVQAQVSSTQRSVQEVSTGLGRLAQATSALKNTTDEIASFQQLLKAPKVRGSFGEVLLNNLLGDVLPVDRYETQYTLKSSGEIVDAIIKLQDGFIVAIDAKFPLANYEVFAREENAERKRSFRSQVKRDIKKHISDISKKYIAPTEQTLDYAFMYIPVEGVYYETMVKDQDEESLWDFCLQQHVVPVSPNSLLAYLHTILVGLRGMKIEQQAQEILQHLSQVRKDFGNFKEDFDTVGKHLGNAKNRFDDSARRLDKFGNRLEQIEGGKSDQLPEGDK